MRRRGGEREVEEQWAGDELGVGARPGVAWARPVLFFARKCRAAPSPSCTLPPCLCSGWALSRARLCAWIVGRRKQPGAKPSCVSTPSTPLGGPRVYRRRRGGRDCHPLHRSMPSPVASHRRLCGARVGFELGWWGPPLPHGPRSWVRARRARFPRTILERHEMAEMFDTSTH